jgi:hypothetical protein
LARALKNPTPLTDSSMKPVESTQRALWCPLGPETHHNAAFSVKGTQTSGEGATMVIVKRGDKIYTYGSWGTQHYGIFLGNVAGYSLCFVHNNGTGVELTTYEAFSNGNDAFLKQAAPNNPAIQEVIAQRALLLLGQ